LSSLPSLINSNVYNNITIDYDDKVHDVAILGKKHKNLEIMTNLVKKAKYLINKKKIHL